eukprot:3374093-Lingulodinium_polyedra.AAC.1
MPETFERLFLVGEGDGRCAPQEVRSGVIGSLELGTERVDGRGGRAQDFGPEGLRDVAGLTPAGLRVKVC